jgi:glutamyl-tRNA synthetase
LSAKLTACEPWDSPTLHRVIEAFAAEKGKGLGDIAQPLRVAVSGGTVSPPIHDTLAILGKASTIKRIERCINVCGG